MAAEIIGALLFTWRGPWSSSTAYDTDDIVSHGGASWIALEPSTNVTPVVGPKWDLLAARGEPGPGGGALVKEAPTGAINGTNVTFTTSLAYVSGSTLLYLNGLAQSEPDDYVEATSTTVVMTNPPLPGDRLLIQYAEA